MTQQCPHCHTDAELAFTAQDYNQRLKPDLFTYFRCRLCHLIFLAPIPDDLGAYYNSEYPAYQAPRVQDIESRAQLESYKLDIVRHYISAGRLLEIGPSYGAFAYLAKKAGFHVDAIEMDAQCCQFLTEGVGINAIHSNDIVGVLENCEPYDVVVMWHAIEHLEDPWHVLSRIADRLKPGGLLILTAPNPDSLQYRTFGRYWVHVDAPRHLRLLPSANICEWLRQREMLAESIITNDAASQVFMSHGWWFVSLRNVIDEMLGIHGKKEALAKPPLQRMLYRLCCIAGKVLVVIGYYLCWRWVEQWPAQGPAYTAVFRKSPEGRQIA